MKKMTTDFLKNALIVSAILSSSIALPFVAVAEDDMVEVFSTSIKTAAKKLDANAPSRKAEVGVILKGVNVSGITVPTEELYDIWVHADDTRRDLIVGLSAPIFMLKTESTDVNMDKTFGIRFNRSIDLATDEFVNRTLSKDESFSFVDANKAFVDIKDFLGFRFLSCETAAGSRNVKMITGVRTVDAKDENAVFKDKVEAMRKIMGNPVYRSNEINVNPSFREVVAWRVSDQQKQAFIIRLMKVNVNYSDSGKKAIVLEIEHLSNPSDDFGFAKLFWQWMERDQLDQIVMVDTDKGTGTGVLLFDEDRVWMFTNAHMITNAVRISATSMSGGKLVISQVQYGADRDLARIAVSGDVSGCLPARARPNIDDEICIKGNSAGGSVATKITGRVLGVGPRHFEISAQIVPGNSGSPVFNKEGRVVGIATGAVMPQSDIRKGREMKEGTRYNELRYFATRIDNVSWKPWR